MTVNAVCLESFILEIADWLVCSVAGLLHNHTHSRMVASDACFTHVRLQATTDAETELQWRNQVFT